MELTQKKKDQDLAESVCVPKARVGHHHTDLFSEVTPTYDTKHGSDTENCKYVHQHENPRFNLHLTNSLVVVSLCMLGETPAEHCRKS